MTPLVLLGVPWLVISMALSARVTRASGRRQRAVRLDDLLRVEMTCAVILVIMQWVSADEGMRALTWLAAAAAVWATAVLLTRHGVGTTDAGA